MSLMKSLAKATLNALGYEVRKIAGGVGKSFSSDPIQAQRQLINDLKKTNVSIFDIGANRGQTARRYRSAFPRADIYCFEPFQDSITELQKRFADDGKIHIVPKAVGRESGIATLFVNENSATNSLLARPSSARRYFPRSAELKETISVEVVDLDGFSRAKGISTIDILKFDIQGGELGALMGAENLLEAARISLLYTEIMFISHYEGAPLFHEIWSFLSRYGYSLFDIYDLHRATNGQIRYGDALFVSESVRANVIDKYPHEP
jgi:FkbM family methyltransferase